LRHDESGRRPEARTSGGGSPVGFVSCVVAVPRTQEILVRSSTAAFVFGATLLTACGGSATLGDRMFDHFQRAGQIQTSLIVGDLDGARRPAGWLAEHVEPTDLGPASETWVPRMREAARAVVGAASVDEAANAAGRIGATCAGCHAASGDGPRFRSAAGAPPARTRGQHMIGHLWAMDRMWEGLIGGSDETWRAGARALAETEPEQGFPGGGTAVVLARAVHDQASAAERAPVAERPAAYAEMIKACAACHALSGVGG
jgi:cytochrome c553